MGREVIEIGSPTVSLESKPVAFIHHVADCGGIGSVSGEGFQYGR